MREFYYEAEAKRGELRRELVVETCFASLLGWVLERWEGQQLALALDATSLGQRFVVLVVSVVYRGCAIGSGLGGLAHAQKTSLAGALVAPAAAGISERARWDDGHCPG